jgi:hypothetical protein
MTAPALTTQRTIGSDRRAHGTDLQEFAKLLGEQRTNTVDLVVPASALTMKDGQLIVDTEIMTEDGVTAPGSRYTITRTADEGLSQRLYVPREFLGRAHHGGTIGKKNFAPNLGLYDSVINESMAPAPDARWLLRLLTGHVEEDGTDGYLRAFLTNGYKVIDNLDVLVATLQGITAAGIDPATLQIQAELTETRMYVRVHAPEVNVAAADLLKDYRSPYRDAETGRYLTGSDLPLIYAGFTVTNSETGQGAAGITPQAVVRICKNGQTWKSDMMREVHLGQRLEDGVVKASAETQRIMMELIRSQAADAVATFLSRAYLEKKVDQMREAAGVEIPAGDEPARAAVEIVKKECTFTQSQADAVLADFLFGGQSTVGGMVQAVTSAAQLQSSADEQWKLEGATERVLALAPKLARV